MIADIRSGYFAFDGLARIVAPFNLPRGNVHQKGFAVSTAPAVTSEIVKSLAPSGTLLVTLNCGNTVLVQGTPDAPSGVTVDLARELAKRLGVPVKFHPYPGAGEAFEGFRK